MVPSFVIEASRSFLQGCNLGSRRDGSDGTPEQQLVGVIAQNMAHLAIGQPFMVQNEGHDGGTDFFLFGQNIDIKAMGRTVDVGVDYVNNIVASQMRLNASAFIFTSYNTRKEELTVCGWLPKALLSGRGQLFKRGATRSRSDGSTFETKADMYEVRNRDIIHAASNWPELWQQMATWAAAKQMLANK